MPEVLNKRRATSEIVGELKARLEALESEPGTKAFERVELFDSEDLAAAFQFLVIGEQRVCVIVPLDEEFETVLSGLKVMVKRRLPVALLMGDRVLGDRKKALWGGDDEIGAMGLMELAAPAVTGLLLPPSGGATGVVAEPRMVSVLTVADSEKKLPGRVTVALELECRGGYLETSVGPGPVF